METCAMMRESLLLQPHRPVVANFSSQANSVCFGTIRFVSAQTLAATCRSPGFRGTRVENHWLMVRRTARKCYAFTLLVAWRTATSWYFRGEIDCNLLLCLTTNHVFQNFACRLGRNFPVALPPGCGLVVCPFETCLILTRIKYCCTVAHRLTK